MSACVQSLFSLGHIVLLNMSVFLWFLRDHGIQPSVRFCVSYSGKLFIKLEFFLSKIYFY